MKTVQFILIILGIFGCSRHTPDSPLPRPPIFNPPDSTDTTANPPVTKDTAVEYFVGPAQTDPQINSFLDSHFVSVQKKSALRNTLFVFLPGSYAKPIQYKGIVQKAASLGYNAVGLMYPDNKPVNNFCAGTNDTTCHRRARMEIVDGVDRSATIEVDKPNSIINRLTKLILYLDRTHPDEHWGRFIKGDSIDWTNVIMAGHSQGGGNAAVMGRYYPLKKVIMFSMMDFMNNGKVPDWENMTYNKGKYYDLFSPLDEIISYNSAKLGWEHMDMTSANSAANNSDEDTSPYGHAHVLLTRQQPAKSVDPKYHNSTAMDAYIRKDTSGKYVLDAQWEYLITE